MRTLKTEILILGGGATGTGLIRDLAMRGFKTILVEQNDLATGTTGRYHGLLHSGGRYVVKDPLAAKDCIDENQILRRIMPQCIEDTGGFFVLTPNDDPAYADSFQAGCRQVGIPCDEISISRMLRAEPLLNPNSTRCFRVPDASADSFLAADLNAESARQYGAIILKYHRVLRLITNLSLSQDSGLADTSESPTSINGALCHDLVKDEQVCIDADLVINAAGAWAGKIAATAGITVQMTPGKGILMAVAHRVVNTVINRCKMPGDGDILVPAHTVAVIGTTDVKVPDPDHFGVEAWEIELMLDEGEQLIPGFRDFRFLRTWAGVRPLYQEMKPQETETNAGNRDITRAFVLLDHAVRDGLEGFLTITSGKWTTYRKMAEVTADKACEKLGVKRACRTHLETLPSVSSQANPTAQGQSGTSAQRFHHLGHRLAQIEANHSYGNLVCECELATREDVTHAILEGNAQSLDDIRRDIRLGMGPCQAGFCTLRSAGLLHQLASRRPPSQDERELTDRSQRPAVEDTNIALRNFLQERWKGVRPVLWGQQLRQERLNELVYVNVLNADHLPGPLQSRLSPKMYAQEDIEPPMSAKRIDPSLPSLSIKSETPRRLDLVVIGAGFAGLTAAWQAAANGKNVKVITKGWGATHWASGSIDVLGYYPIGQSDPVSSPAEAFGKLILDQPHHPYALAGFDAIYLAIRSLQDLFSQSGYPLHGSLTENWILPTALGTLRPTCLAPRTMIAGDLRDHVSILIVGFEQFMDFYPAMIAANLNTLGIPTEGIVLDLPDLRKRRLINGMVLARLFDRPEFRAEVAKALKPRLGKAQRVGFPAVLGLYQSIEALNDLEAQLERPVFEIPGLPPSIPGIRLHNQLTRAIQHCGGKVFDGMQTTGGYAQNSHLQAVLTETGARQIVQEAETFVLATGGILGGGLIAPPPGSGKNPLVETALGLPIKEPAERKAWFQEQFLSEISHPIYQSGIMVNAHFQPVDDTGKPYYDNLFAIGGALANCDPVRERSLEGVAVVTGYCFGGQIFNQ